MTRELLCFNNKQTIGIEALVPLLNFHTEMEIVFIVVRAYC